MSKDEEEEVLLEPIPPKSDIQKIKVCMYITPIGKQDLDQTKDETKKSIGDIYEYALRFYLAAKQEIEKGKTITFRNK